MFRVLKIVGILCMGLLGLSACASANLALPATLSPSPLPVSPTTTPTVQSTLAASPLFATVTSASPTAAPSATADAVDVRPQFLYSYASW